MGFSIDYGFGLLGGLVIAALAVVGIIVLVVFLQGARQAHDDVVEHDVDHKGPEL